MAFDIVITLGSTAVERAVLRILEPILQRLPGVYPLVTPGASNAALAVDAVRPRVTATVAGDALRLQLEVRGRLLGELLAALPTPVTLSQVNLPFGHLERVPLGSTAGGSTTGLGLTLNVDVPLSVAGPSQATDQELWLTPGEAQLAESPRADAAAAADFFRRTREQLGSVVRQATGGESAFADLPAAYLAQTLDSLQIEAGNRVRALLTGLPSISLGRVVAPAGGNSCAAKLVPTGGTARIITEAGSMYLQIGLMQRGRAVQNQDFPAPSARAGALNVTISNLALVRLLACVIETMPNLLVRGEGTIRGEETATPCCRWEGAILNLGPLAFSDVILELCVSRPGWVSVLETTGGRVEGSVPKTVRLSFTARQRTAALNIELTGEVELDLDLTPSAEVLCAAIPNITTDVDVSQTPGLAVAITTVPFIGGWLEGITLLLIAFANAQLDALVRSAFQPLKSLPTVPVIPPGLLDAIGDFTSQAVAIDDLSATGTSWAKPGLREKRPWSQEEPQPHEDVRCAAARRAPADEQIPP